MDLLLVHVMLWARNEGYQRFSLGWRRYQASNSRRWRRSGTGWGAFLDHYGGLLYNFQGLRAYKEKFDPGVGAARSR